MKAMQLGHVHDCRIDRFQTFDAGSKNDELLVLPVVPLSEVKVGV